MCWALGTLGPAMLQPVLDPQEPQGLLQQLLEHTQRQLDTVTPQVGGTVQLQHVAVAAQAVTTASSSCPPEHHQGHVQ